MGKTTNTNSVLVNNLCVHTLVCTAQQAKAVMHHVSGKCSFIVISIQVFELLAVFLDCCLGFPRLGFDLFCLFCKLLLLFQLNWSSAICQTYLPVLDPEASPTTQRAAAVNERGLCAISGCTEALVGRAGCNAWPQHQLQMCALVAGPLSRSLSLPSLYLCLCFGMVMFCQRERRRDEQPEWSSVKFGLRLMI